MHTENNLVGCSKLNVRIGCWLQWNNVLNSKRYTETPSHSPIILPDCLLCAIPDYCTSHHNNTSASWTQKLAPCQGHSSICPSWWLSPKCQTLVSWMSHARPRIRNTRLKEWCFPKDQNFNNLNVVCTELLTTCEQKKLNYIGTRHVKKIFVAFVHENNWTWWEEKLEHR